MSKQDDKPQIQYQHLRSFSRRAATLADARQRHDMVEQAASTAKLAQQALEQLWVAIVRGQPKDDEPANALERAVDMTMPRELLPLLRAGDDLPAGAAFVLAVQALAQVNTDDEYACRQALPQVWAKLTELATQAADLEEGFGCDRAAAWRTLRSVRDVKNPALTKKIAEIAQLAGRMHDSMRRVAQLSECPAPHEVIGTTTGRDVERLLPAEQAKLAVPELATAQAMRVLTGEADVQHLQGRTTTSRGPIVIMLDESGSMHDEAGQIGRNTWAKAAALALARLALTEGRKVRAVHFGTACAVQQIDDQAALLELVQSFVGGGTAFVPALKQAMQQAFDMSDATKGADVVAITDGEDGDDEPTRKDLNALVDQMQAKGVRLWTVGIGRDQDPEFPLRKRAERYVFAHDRDLKLRHAAVRMATELTGAALNARRDLN